MTSADANPDVLNVYDLTDGLVAKPATDPAGELSPAFFQGVFVHAFSSVTCRRYTDNRTVAALHAPTSKLWEESVNYPFNGSSTLGDQSTLASYFFRSCEYVSDDNI